MRSGALARINVEDDWFADPLERRAALIKKLADSPVNAEWMADGAALKAWRIAQRFWKDGRKPIPEDVWARAGLEPLIDCGLASRKHDGIYVHGTEAQHEWLAEWSEKSVKGGKARVTGAERDEKGRFQPKTDESQPTSSHCLDSLDQPTSHSPALSSTLLSSTLDNSPNGESLVVAGDDSARVPFKAFAQAWLDNAAGLKPKTKVELTDDRKRKMRARWKERPDVAYWATCAKKMGASTFCQESGWATFDWLIKNGTNHVKVTDGNYDDHGASSGDEYWSKINWDAP